MTSKSEMFAAYDGDVQAILEAWPNLDPEGYASWERTALIRLLSADVRRWQSRQTVTVEADARAEQAGQGRLVDVPAKRKRVEFRAKVSTDGGSVDFMALAGDQGALTLRQAALRDKPAAATTLARCERLLRIAELIEAETARLGRPVSVAEVIERVAA
jgi:hypothetical protein